MAASRYASPAATARRWGCTRQYIDKLLREKPCRIRGVKRLLDQLDRPIIAIPISAEKPPARKRGPKPKANA